MKVLSTLLSLVLLLDPLSILLAFPPIQPPSQKAERIPTTSPSLSFPLSAQLAIKSSPAALLPSFRGACHSQAPSHFSQTTAQAPNAFGIGYIVDSKRSTRTRPHPPLQAHVPQPLALHVIFQKHQSPYNCSHTPFHELSLLFQITNILQPAFRPRV